MINVLHNRVKERMGEKRFLHTLGVVKMTEYLAEKCLPDMLVELIYAAYLHDITKEIPDEEQFALLKKCPFEIDEDEFASKPIHHSFTAPTVVKKDFPEYSTDRVLSAVQKHTVGDADMSTFDLIIFVADYVEENRTYKSCVRMRDELISGMTDDVSHNVLHLNKIALKIIDLTLDFIKKSGHRTVRKTLLAKEAIERKIKEI